MNEEFSFGTLSTDALRLEQVKRQHSGLIHLNRIVPLDPFPGKPVQVVTLSGGGFAPKKVTCRYTTDNSDPAGERAIEVPMESTGVEWDTLTWSYLTTWQAILPPQPAGTLVRYRILGYLWNNPVPMFADGLPEFRYWVDDDPVPSWASEAIIYQIFADRFFPGRGMSWKEVRTPADFYGGTLQGITDKIDYLRDLGVNCLWLSPCFPSPTHHGYDITDLFTIEPRLGNIADLSELIRQAHQREIRVVLDFVANHISNCHPTFQSATKDPSSPFCDWFIWHHWPDDYQSFFGVKEMPEWNLDNPATRQYVIDAAVFWTQECDVDGYRLDYAYGPPHDFWVDFRRAIRAVKPDTWLFGEIVETPELQRSFYGRLDGTLDFMLTQALRGLFAFGSWNVEHFNAFLYEHETFFPRDFSLPVSLDNHDINRFLWVAKGNKDKLKLAALCLFTLSGPPIIYYGTEVGLSQERDIRQNGLGLLEESRLPMLWDDAQDKDLLDYFRKLIILRRLYPVLYRGQRYSLYVDAEAGIYAYQHRYGHETIVVVLNVQASAGQLKLKGVPAFDIIKERNYPVDDQGNVYLDLAPWEGVLLMSARAEHH